MTEPPSNDAPGRDEPSAEGTPPANGKAELPQVPYGATLRLIRSRLADEARSERKPWWRRWA